MNKSTASRPIAVLDSGLGGLTVVNALRKLLPAEDLIYFGDTAPPLRQQIPRHRHRIRPPDHSISIANGSQARGHRVQYGHGPGVAQSSSRISKPFPQRGHRARCSRRRRLCWRAKQIPVIGVIATEATVKSKAYQRAILRRRSMANVLLRPTPLLVPMIEEGRTAGDAVVEMALTQYLHSMMQRKIDVLVLGCTHYPLLRTAIAKVVGPTVRLIDSAEQCAQDVARRLNRKRLLREPTDWNAALGRSEGTLKTFVTDDPAKFSALAERFLRMQLPSPVLVNPKDLYGGQEETPLRLHAAG